MSYIVMVSPAYGGAEKRFFDVFCGLRRQGMSIHYVAPSMLAAKLREDHPERTDVFAGLLEIPLVRWSPMQFVLAWRRMLMRLPRGSAFHYPMNCLWPLHLGRGDRLSMSVVDCMSVPRLMRTPRSAALNRIAFAFVRRVDVLSPSVYAHVQATRASAKTSLTPGGTYMLPTRAGGSKTPSAVFLGRLVVEKGILDLLERLSALWEALRPRVGPDFRLRIAGYGPLEAQVRTAVDAAAAQGIPVVFDGYQAASDALDHAAVLLSLQTVTNYPSRVVAESLFAGTAVIVRDSGDSREFGAHLPGLEYCADELESEALAEAIARLSHAVCTDACLRDAMRAAAHERFSSPAYLDYFRALIG